MNKAVRSILILAGAAASIALLVWVVVAARQERAGDPERERPPEGPSRVSQSQGDVIIKITGAEQARNGIEASPLESTTRKPELRANAVVLSVQELTDLRTGYVAARAQFEKAQADFEVSRQEYERLNTLYQNERNASLKAVQAAAGSMRVDEVAVKAAQDSLSLAESNVRQRWGPVIAEWLFSGSSAFQRLIQQEHLLVQVTLPAGLESPAPHTARLQITTERTQPASLMSPLPRLDPRIQARSYLYITLRNPELIPGLNLVVLLPSGAPVQGVVIPGRALVWWQGRAWAYAQTGPEEFVRREVATATPISGGWFVTRNFSKGEKVVTNGAQQLIYEELRSQIKVVGEEGERK